MQDGTLMDTSKDGWRTAKSRWKISPIEKEKEKCTTD